MVCFLLYIAEMVMITILTRRAGLLCNVKSVPFWPYSAWTRGDYSIGFEIILNIGLFAPFGYLAMNLMERKRKQFFIIILGGIYLSALIEVVQRIDILTPPSH